MNLSCSRRTGIDMKGIVSDIKRFAVHDGDGIRTTVFLKGCPLKCVWCHNPESIDFQPQIAYYKHKCVGCGQCVPVCPQDAHSMEEGHRFDAQKCIACGACAKVCLGEAITYYGKEMTPEEVLEILLEDRIFYESSNGGITLSGGECLMQPEFCAVLLKKCKENGLHTAVDTCGFVSRETLDKVIPYTDVFLYDIKALDEDIHIRCTGKSNQIILENLKYLDEKGCKIEIRIPYVPEYNADQMEKIKDFLSGLKHIQKVKVLAYHNFAGSKYDALSMEYTLPTVLPSEGEMEAAEHLFG